MAKNRVSGANGPIHSQVRRVARQPLPWQSSDVYRLADTGNDQCRGRDISGGRSETERHRPRVINERCLGSIRHRHHLPRHNRQEIVKRCRCQTIYRRVQHRYPNDSCTACFHDICRVTFCVHRWGGRRVF